MEKEKLIKRKGAISPGKSGVSNKFTKGGSRTIKPIPNLNFVKIQRQVIQATEEVKKLRNFSFMMRMRKMILAAAGQAAESAQGLEGADQGEEGEVVSEGFRGGVESAG